ncbi:hypothetical protein [Gloeothece verrucosa]|uniref:hypothetical protein n=1 Tax=Gloeothece verrucosa TaxID=2546359 RepID=UPI0005A53F6D|nr:hypothetical protein [Gloeothece verrucosa]
MFLPTVLPRQPDCIDVLLPQSPWVLATNLFLEDLDLITVKFFPKHRKPTIGFVSCLEPHNLSCQGTVPSPEFGGSDFRLPFTLNLVSG